MPATVTTAASSAARFGALPPHFVTSRELVPWHCHVVWGLLLAEGAAVYEGRTVLVRALPEPVGKLLETILFLVVAVIACHHQYLTMFVQVKTDWLDNRHVVFGKGKQLWMARVYPWAGHTCVGFQ